MARGGTLESSSHILESFGLLLTLKKLIRICPGERTNRTLALQPRKRELLLSIPTELT
jgi:hypothetical protein